MTPNNDYGLLIEPINRYGAEYIDARVVRRDPKYEHPIGCPSDGDVFLGYGTPKHLLGLVLDGLGMYGFVTDGNDPTFIGTEIEFRETYGINEPKLRRMLKTMRRVNARIAKDQAREPGDKFTSLAAALKLSFAVERIARRGDGRDWRWMSIAEGRNRYRALIDTAVAAAVSRKIA
jgi:hypothetical protein